MAISMVRKPSETPNITNIDDIIPFRYAYGNQNGYVIGRGAELSHTVNGNQFTINSGRIVIQGVESDVDANGVTLTIDSVSETRYYVVYYEVNLATNTTNIKLSDYDTAGYPTIDIGDDLTSNSSGIARLPLYRFTAKSGAISGVEKVVKAVEYSGTALVGYDISKGTVEERLEKLGFKQGSITLNSGNTATINTLKRQGNYVVGSLQITAVGNLTSAGGTTNWLSVIGNVSREFIPKGYSITFSDIFINKEKGRLSIDSYGQVVASYNTSSAGIGTRTETFSITNFGYEANPL